MCVRACACYHSRGGIVTFYTLRTALSRYTLHFQLVDFELRSEVMASFATPQALYWLWHRGDVTIKLCYVMLAAIGVQHVQVAANIPAKYTGFPGIIPGFSVSSRYPGISAKYTGFQRLPVYIPELVLSIPGIGD